MELQNKLVTATEQKFPLRYLNIERIPDTVVGVYAFWFRNSKCLYVGKAKDQPLKNRLLQEWKGSHNPNLKRYISAFAENIDICYIVINRERINRAEELLIKKWHPETNIIHNRR